MNISTRQVIDRLKSRIENAPIDPMPSENIYMEDLFDPALYSEILSRLPHKEAYDYIDHHDANLPDGTSTRMLLDLTGDTLPRLKPEDRDFWGLMNDVFISDVLQGTITHKFREAINKRFGDEWPEMVTVPVFYKDYPGYFISVHPDTDLKVATMQVYLPADESQIHLGTSFHYGKANQFRLIKTNLFKPNSGYSFVRTDNSWHSVKKIESHERERNTLALTIYLKRKQYKSAR